MYRVSVIMPFLDEERFLAEAIESVLAQTFGDWELLLVDDGSRDASPRIARDAVERGAPRVRYLTHPGGTNRGMSRSRNLGIEESNGEYLAFLDGDDVYLPSKLEGQVALLDRHPDVAMTYGATQHWYSWTGRPEDQDRDVDRRLGVEPETSVAPPDLVTKFLRGEAQTPGMCGLLVRRSVLVHLGGFEPAFRGMFEDMVMVCKICLTHHVFVESGRRDRYRQHEGSHSRTMRRRGLYRSSGPNLTYGRFILWLSRYADRIGVDDPDFRSALHGALAPYRSPASYLFAAARYHCPKLLRKLSRLWERDGGAGPP